MGPRLRRERRALWPMLAALVAFLALCVAVVHAPAMARFDVAANAVFRSYHPEPLVRIFLWITALGSGAALVPTVVVATGLLWSRGGTQPIAPLWIGFLGAEASVWATKFAIGRLRPEFLDFASAESPSFPSAHTAGATVVYGLLASIVIDSVPKDAVARPIVVAFTATLIALIAFSRILLGVHYPSDVAGGLLIGVFWFGAGIALWRR